MPLTRVIRSGVVNNKSIPGVEGVIAQVLKITGGVGPSELPLVFLELKNEIG